MLQRGRQRPFKSLCLGSNRYIFEARTSAAKKGNKEAGKEVIARLQVSGADNGSATAGQTCTEV